MNKELKSKKDSKKFDQISREVFAPIYPKLAQQIKQATRITQGKCLDAGCGTGALSRAVLNETNLDMTYLDHSIDMLELAKQYALDNNLTSRSVFLNGDIHKINVDDKSFDLVVSRGSCFFWNDLHVAFSEILRVLKNGGKAYIGGGFANKKLKQDIDKIMLKKNQNWLNDCEIRVNPYKEKLPHVLKSLNLENYSIIDDESGYWAFITKKGELK